MHKKFTLSDMPSTQHMLINAVLFQLCWFSAVLMASYWALLPLGLMFLHYLQVRGTTGLLIVILLGVLGILFDSLYLYLGIYHLDAQTAVLPLLNLPVWLACLWLGFCLSLPLSLAWLVKKPAYFIVGCMILGPVSYMAGRRLQAIDFSDINIGFLVLEWAVFAFLICLALGPKLTAAAELSIVSRKPSSC